MAATERKDLYQTGRGGKTARRTSRLKQETAPAGLEALPRSSLWAYASFLAALFMALSGFFFLCYAGFRILPLPVEAASNSSIRFLPSSKQAANGVPHSPLVTDDNASSNPLNPRRMADRVDMRNRSRPEAEQDCTTNDPPERDNIAPLAEEALDAVAGPISAAKKLSLALFLGFLVLCFLLELCIAFFDARQSTKRHRRHKHLHWKEGPSVSNLVCRKRAGKDKRQGKQDGSSLLCQEKEKEKSGQIKKIGPRSRKWVRLFRCSWPRWGIDEEERHQREESGQLDAAREATDPTQQSHQPTVRDYKRSGGLQRSCGKLTWLISKGSKGKHDADDSGTNKQQPERKGSCGEDYAAEATRPATHYTSIPTNTAFSTREGPRPTALPTQGPRRVSGALTTETDHMKDFDGSGKDRGLHKRGLVTSSPPNSTNASNNNDGDSGSGSYNSPIEADHHGRETAESPPAGKKPCSWAKQQFLEAGSNPPGAEVISDPVAPGSKHHHSQPYSCRRALHPTRPETPATLFSPTKEADFCLSSNFLDNGSSGGGGGGGSSSKGEDDKLF